MDIDNVERRITRSVLTDISTPRTVYWSPALVDDTQANIARNSPLSATASPEEMVIQQRGRRKMPVTWSPDIDCAKRNGPSIKERTPVKTPVKTTIVLRSTPRKRLMLTDTGGTPDKHAKKTPSPWKKARMERTSASAIINSSAALSPLQTALKGLSPGQLIGVIETLVSDHPDLENKIVESLPTPDISPLEERVCYLKGNIFKSLPTSRLTSKTDSPAYSRAATHVNAFKKCVIEQGKVLVESQHWNSVVDYVLMAWRYVRETPLWDNPPHNSGRKQCFHALTSMVVHALRRGSWSKSQLESIFLRQDSGISRLNAVYRELKKIKPVCSLVIKKEEFKKLVWQPSWFKKCEDDTHETDSNVKQILELCKSKLQ